MKGIKAPFYLTGGTALSRHYYSVRYSDDLYLFVNDDPSFSDWIERFYVELRRKSRNGDFTVLTERIQRYEHYTQLYVSKFEKEESELVLKIDLVNDVAPHYGEIEADEVLGRVDSWRNILSNKVPALYRLEAKDVVDLWALARFASFSWSDIVREAATKEGGIDPVAIHDLLMSFPKDELANIKWIGQAPEAGTMMNEIQSMATDIFEGKINSLNAFQDH